MSRGFSPRATNSSSPPLARPTTNIYTVTSPRQMSPLSIPDFVARWQRSTLSERSAAQQHFLGLCEILGQPTPAEIDQEGNTYTFEKGVTKTFGGDGFADVWMRGFFAWKYKGKHKDLNASFKQLLQYREDLENPPLLVVCDFNRFEVHTNHNNAQKQIFAFELADLVTNLPSAICKLPPLEVPRALFTDPGRLNPGQTTAQVTEAAAAQFSTLAESLRSRGVPSERAAHFLMRLLFCLFSEDIGLFPGKLFSRLPSQTSSAPPSSPKGCANFSAPCPASKAHSANTISHTLTADYSPTTKPTTSPETISPSSPSLPCLTGPASSPPSSALSSSAASTHCLCSFSTTFSSHPECKRHHRHPTAIL